MRCFTWDMFIHWFSDDQASCTASPPDADSVFQRHEINLAFKRHTSVYFPVASVLTKEQISPGSGRAFLPLWYDIGLKPYNPTPHTALPSVPSGNHSQWKADEPSKYLWPSYPSKLRPHHLLWNGTLQVLPGYNRKLSSSFPSAWWILGQQIRTPTRSGKHDSCSGIGVWALSILPEMCWRIISG